MNSSTKRTSNFEGTVNLLDLQKINRISNSQVVISRNMNLGDMDLNFHNEDQLP